MKAFKKSLVYLLWLLSLSLICGAIDFWLVNGKGGNHLFSKAVRKLNEGGAYYIGMGYTLTTFVKGEGEHGTEIHYWFLPVTFYRTSVRSGIHLVSRKPREPVYKNRTLSEWLDVFCRGFSGKSSIPSLEETEAAKTAIRAIGTNAIPSLLFWLSDDYPGSSRRGNAELAFEFLGEAGRPATGQLIGLTSNGNVNVRLRALLCLEHINAENEFFIPALKQLRNDSDARVRYYAREELLARSETPASNDKAKSSKNLPAQVPTNEIYEK